MVITGHGQHAAPRGGTGHVGVFEHIRATVNARAFAIPNAKHAIELVAALGRKTQLLCAPQGRGSQLFVDPGLEDDVLGFQVVFGFPQRLVVAAQGGAAVAADKARGVFALQGIALSLQHGQFDQSLHAAHEGAPHIETVFVVQCHRGQGLANRFGQRGVHGRSCCGYGLHSVGRTHRQVLALCDRICPMI